MSSISESAKYGQKLLDSGAVKYIETPQAPPAIPAPTNAYPAAPNQYLRAPLPDDMWQQPDGQRQFHIAAIPQTRISPLPENTNPVVGAQAASQSLAIQNSSLLLETNNVVNPVQSILNLKQGTGITLAPDAAGGVVITGTSAGGFAITGVNRQSFGSFDSSYSTSSISNVTALSITGTTAGANELAITGAISRNGGLEVAGQAPDGTWTNVNLGTFWKVIAAAGSQTVSQAFGATVNPSVQELAFFKTNGSTPVFATKASGSGGSNPLVTISFTPTAGRSLIFLSSLTSGITTPSTYSATDTQGNVWTQVVYSFATNGGRMAQVVMLYAQNVVGGATTVTITESNLVGLNGFGTWSLQEVSNIGNISSGSYTFQSSDANKLVQFTGGAAVTATLPSPALSSGWIALVSNDSAGAVTITSAAVLNNVIGQNVVIPPGADTWIFSDGTSYWTSTVASYPDFPAQANKFLTGYKAQTGTVLSAQPAFSNLSGNISTSQMNGGASATSSSFWRGDGTWAVPFGGVNTKTANYTAVATDANTLLSFNSAGAVTLTLPSTSPSGTWFIAVQNTGSGILTINRNGRNIDGIASNLTLFQNQGVLVYSDNGGNYFTERGMNQAVAQVDLTAQTAAVGTTTLYAVSAGGAAQYRLSWNAKVTTAAGTSSTLGALTIVYTDPDGVAQTITAAAQSSAGVIETTDAGNSTTTVMLGMPLLLNCKASTNITYAFAYASNAANTMAYNLHVRLESL